MGVTVNFWFSIGIDSLNDITKKKKNELFLISDNSSDGFQNYHLNEIKKIIITETVRPDNLSKRGTFTPLYIVTGTVRIWKLSGRLESYRDPTMTVRCFLSDSMESPKHAVP